MKLGWKIPVVLVGVVLGLLILRSNLLKSSGNNSSLVDMSTKETKKPEVIIGDEKKIVEKQEIWEIIGWDAKTGILSLMGEDGEEKQLKVDPERMKVMIPPPQRRTNEMTIIHSTDDLNWESAFCIQDRVTVAYSGSGEVVLVMNTGFRACGRKSD